MSQKKFYIRIKINISISTSKLSIFNYTSFYKVLSINQVRYKIKKLLENQQSISLQNLDNNTHIVVQEIFKLFMSQISSLTFWQDPKINFTFHPEAKGCLKNLSKLSCTSNTKFFINYPKYVTIYN